MIHKLLSNQKGISLVEVIASIVLMTIILISFFGLFVQSSKTEKTSEQIINATYVAQVEMEKIYELSKLNTLEHLDEGLSSIGYTPLLEQHHTYEKVQGKFNIKLRIYDFSSSTIKKTVIEVYENNILKSKMENIYSWRVN